MRLRDLNSSILRIGRTDLRVDVGVDRDLLHSLVRLRRKRHGL
jgi:hypothetical protein